MEIVFFLHIGGDFLAAPEKKVLIEPLALLVDIDGHYMDMVSVDVLVLVDYERLLSEAEFFQILAGDDFILLLCQSVVGVRIERDVENRLFGLAGLGHEGVEILHHAGYVNLPVCRKNYFVPSQHPSLLLVHFLPVV